MAVHGTVGAVNKRQFWVRKRVGSNSRELLIVLMLILARATKVRSGNAPTLFPSNAITDQSFDYLGEKVLQMGFIW